MNTIILILQGIVALMFAMAGTMKSTQPREKLLKGMPWVAHFSIATVRFIGVSELLGAIGIIVPQLTGLYPILSAVAASGLAVIMILAASHHIPRKEYKETMFNTVLFALSAIVALYRFM